MSRYRCWLEDDTVDDFISTDVLCHSNAVDEFCKFLFTECDANEWFFNKPQIVLSHMIDDDYVEIGNINRHEVFVDFEPVFSFRILGEE